MEVKLFEIAERIRCLREILGITVEEMAAACMVDSMGACSQTWWWRS